MPFRTRIVALALAASAFSATPLAHADDAAKACAGTFEQAQGLQRALKLRAAHAAATSCVAATCPSFVRDACQSLVTSIDAAQPSLVFSVQDEKGDDLTAVSVLLDGMPLVSHVGAEAVPVDPGEHVLRFVRGAQAPIDQHVLVRVGETNRIIKVKFANAGAPVHDEPADTSAPSLVLPITVAAVGLVSVGVSVAVGASAQTDANNLQRTCAPSCSTDSVSDVRTKLVVSDVLLGVGIAAVATAAIVFFARRSGHTASTPAALVVTPSQGVGFRF